MTMFISKKLKEIIRAIYCLDLVIFVDNCSPTVEETRNQSVIPSFIIDDQSFIEGDKK